MCDNDPELDHDDEEGVAANDDEECEDEGEERESTESDGESATTGATVGRCSFARRNPCRHRSKLIN